MHLVQCAVFISICFKITSGSFSHALVITAASSQYFNRNFNRLITAPLVDSATVSLNTFPLAFIAGPPNIVAGLPNAGLSIQPQLHVSVSTPVAIVNPDDSNQRDVEKDLEESRVKKGDLSQQLPKAIAVATSDGTAIANAFFVPRSASANLITPQINELISNPKLQSNKNYAKIRCRLTDIQNDINEFQTNCNEFDIVNKINKEKKKTVSLVFQGHNAYVKLQPTNEAVKGNSNTLQQNLPIKNNGYNFKGKLDNGIEVIPVPLAYIAPPANQNRHQIHNFVPFHKVFRQVSKPAKIEANLVTFQRNPYYSRSSKKLLRPRDIELTTFNPIRTDSFQTVPPKK